MYIKGNYSNQWQREIANNDWDFTNNTSNTGEETSKERERENYINR